MKKHFLIIFTCVVFLMKHGSANNIQVSNVSIFGSNIIFDLSWENSWHDMTNWDAAWVFIKFRYPNDNWNHVILNTSGHNVPSAANVTTSSDGMGVFIHRDNVGTGGNNNFLGISLSWNTQANGIISTENLQVKVMAIEMVYVPQGSFYLGDSLSRGTFRRDTINAPQRISNLPVIVKSSGSVSGEDSQIQVGGILVDGNDGIDSDGNTNINNHGYPTGYKAFYCMKYEISQGQYADFLNTLNASQVTSRYPVYTTNRYTISGSWPNITASVPDRACNYISYMDDCAYADWSGLRPMTELEFEKACRGTALYVKGDKAWGNPEVCSAVFVLSGNNTPNELITDPCESIYGNALYSSNFNNIDGPVRCGIFAASAISKTRQETGATYYGIMEMSGNLYERCITLGNQTGRNFTGIHGDGVLSADGYANQSFWPGMSSGIVQLEIGSGVRGGCWSKNIQDLNISDRFYVCTNWSNSRTPNWGFRCVRSAP